ncbi:unnamed protein product, partial [Meganyctiphanes norvegica]
SAVVECEDQYPDCARYMDNCKDDTWMKQNCQKTCGLCIEESAVVECEDKDPICARYMDNCKDNPWVKQNCKKTCGSCNEASTTSPITPITPRPKMPKTTEPAVVQCEDKDPKKCARYMDKCNVNTWMKQNCQKTCGSCIEESAVVECEDKDPICPRYMDKCNDNPWMKQNCQKTCGSCFEEDRGYVWNPEESGQDSISMMEFYMDGGGGSLPEQAEQASVNMRMKNELYDIGTSRRNAFVPSP